jgi:hypothetical protein
MFVEIKPDGEITEAPYSVRRHLLDAINVINERGWCQHAFHTKSGEVCLVGAIITACKGASINAGRLEVDERVSLACQTIGRTLGGGGPIYYNDTPGRTKQEVIALLHKAANQSTI